MVTGHEDPMTIVAGAELGASHQTGWTGALATLMQCFGRTDMRKLLDRPRPASPAGAPRVELR